MLKGFQNAVKTDAGAAVESQLLDFGSQNLQNITKTASKISEISKLRRGCVFGAVLGPFLEQLLISTGPVWRPFWTKTVYNGMKKGMQNSISKKGRKLMPKGFYNEAKIDAKIYENSYFSEKG